MSNPPPTRAKPKDTGFGRDIEMEKDRGAGQPATAEMDSSEAKADAEPILGPAPDPDVYPGAKPKA